MLLQRLARLGCGGASRLSPVTVAFSTGACPTVPTTTATRAALPGGASHDHVRSIKATGGASVGSSARGYAATAADSRDPRFATLEQSDLDAFRRLLGPNGVLTDAASLQAVNKCAACFWAYVVLPCLSLFPAAHPFCTMLDRLPLMKQGPSPARRHA